MQAILRAIAAPVLALEQAEGGVVRLLEANSPACQLLNMEPAALRGAPVHHVWPADLADSLTLAVARALESDADAADVMTCHEVAGRRLQFTHRAVGGQEEPGEQKPGAARLVLCTIAPAPENAPEPENALAPETAPAPENDSGDEAERLRLRGRILDRLIARGGHALGNYVQPILTFSRFAMADLPSETRNTYLQHIHDAGEQIQNLIAVARIVARRDGALQTGEAGAAEVSIDHLIEDAEDVCPMLLPLDVAVRSEILAPDAKVAGSRADLTMALVGLMLDAGDSLIRKGEIVLRVSRGQPENGPENGQAGATLLRLDVESAGARQNDRVPYNGGGIIQRLIARCGGDIWVHHPSPERQQVSIFLPEKG